MENSVWTNSWNLIKIIRKFDHMILMHDSFGGFSGSEFPLNNLEIQTYPCLQKNINLASYVVCIRFTIHFENCITSVLVHILTIFKVYPQMFSTNFLIKVQWYCQVWFCGNGKKRAWYTGTLKSEWGQDHRKYSLEGQACRSRRVGFQPVNILFLKWTLCSSLLAFLCLK